MGTKYNKFLTVLLVIIIIAVVGLLGYLGYNYYGNYSIDSDSDRYVSTFVEDTNTTEENTTTTEGNLSDGISETETASSGSTTKTYKGFNVVGTIEIPKTDVKYPVLEDPPTVKKLDTAVVTLYPQHATLNTVGNVVIVGHNYRNGLFFSNNKKLVNGDKIYITDLNNNRVEYTVYSVFEASENDTSFYNRDTDGAMEITLSTCTDDSSARTIVEAKAE